MKRNLLGLLPLCAMLAISTGSAAGQETRLRSVRVSAPDVVQTATFYETVFGLKEVRRIDRDNKPFERVLNIVQDASANGAGPPNIVILLRPPGAPAPSVSNLVFGVPDVDRIVAAALAAGGVRSREITTSQTSGARIGFIRDPAGNEIELIQEASDQVGDPDVGRGGKASGHSTPIDPSH